METNMGDAAPLQTPYKYGQAVLEGSGIPGMFDSLAVDAPFVFWHRGRFHMLYIGFDGTGYQTGLAESDDLLRWRKKGAVLRRDEHGGWDRVGAAGTWILKEDHDITERPVLKKVDGRYWMVYHAYPGEGYEQGAAEMGLAWSEDEELMDWHRLPAPVFSWRDGEAWERGGLYKACLLSHGGRYHMFYNAKNVTDGLWAEQIGGAVSEDMRRWTRLENNPVVPVSTGRWDSLFASDPCVLRQGERWLMFYYGFDGRHAQDGLAVSGDLIRWEKLPVPVLRHGAAGDVDAVHAHKPAVVFHNGTLYHFYCAVRGHRDGDSTDNGGEYRCITVAASRPL